MRQWPSNRECSVYWRRRLMSPCSHWWCHHIKRRFHCSSINFITVTTGPLNLPITHSLARRQDPTMQSVPVAYPERNGPPPNLYDINISNVFGTCENAFLCIITIIYSHSFIYVIWISILCSKKQPLCFFVITLANEHRFSQFIHFEIMQEIFHRICS